jgi:ankyrin repeat protein
VAGDRWNPNEIANGAMRVATYNNRVEVVKFLMQHPKIDFTHCSALSNACEVGNLEIVKLLLRDPRVDPCRSDGENYTCNHAIANAVRGGHTEIVRLLLTDGRIDPTRGNCSILWGCDIKNTELITLLCNDKRIVKHIRKNKITPPPFYMEYSGPQPRSIYFRSNKK